MSRVKAWACITTGDGLRHIVFMPERQRHTMKRKCRCSPRELNERDGITVILHGVTVCSRGLQREH